MARFAVRVELFGRAGEDDYESLHGEMQDNGYYRVIESGKGEWYHLPTATYDHTSSSQSRSDVCDEVWKIAKSVWNDPGILITEVNGMVWQGLRKASSQEVKAATA